MTEKTQGTGASAPTTVQAGTQPKTAKLTLTTSGGKTREVQVPKGFFNSDAVELNLADEGAVTVCDVAAKEQAARRMKLEEHKDNALQNVLLWVQPEGSSGKYAAVISCEGCKAPVRRFTSDLHQARHCLVCGIKAKRGKVAAKRAEKRAESRQGDAS